MYIENYFENISSLQRALILAGGITFFWMLEYIIPLFRFKYNKIKHAWPNIFFTITTIIVNFAFAYLIVVVSDYTVKHSIGLLHIVKMPLWLFILVGCMVLDLVGAYTIHLIQHKIKWMWKFHIVHHSDMHVDTTTANRHHPVESAFRAVFTTLAVFVAGAPVWLFMLYQSLSAVLSQFNHANISLPKWIDGLMSWILVSPDMHKVHHHYLQPLTDTNYGNIFSIWDRVFRTFAKVNDSNNLIYGIDLLMEDKESQDINKLLKMPFKQYHPLITSKFSQKKAKKII